MNIQETHIPEAPLDTVLLMTPAGAPGCVPCPPEKPRHPCHYRTYVNLPHATNYIILAG